MTRPRGLHRGQLGWHICPAGEKQGSKNSSQGITEPGLCLQQQVVFTESRPLHGRGTIPSDHPLQAADNPHWAVSHVDSAVSLWWGAWGGFLRSWSLCWVGSKHLGLSHLPSGRGSPGILALWDIQGQRLARDGQGHLLIRNPRSGQTLDAGLQQTQPPACTERAHAPTTQCLQKQQPVGGVLLAFSWWGREAESPPPATPQPRPSWPLWQRSLHPTWSPPQPGFAYSLL